MIPAAPPFDVPTLLSRERGGLMAALGRLSTSDWQRHTLRPGWRVRDLVSHIWATDLMAVSRLRDRHDPLVGETPEDSVEAARAHSERWVEATRPLSTAVLVERLRETGPQVTTMFRMEEPDAPGLSVPWAGDAAAPVWFCAARELAERFVHQQQVREAAYLYEYDDEDVLAAVVDTFVHAFPTGLAGVRAEPGTAVGVELTGPVPRRWTFIRSVDGWDREDGVLSRSSSARLTTDAGGFWRLLSGSLDRGQQVERVRLEGTPTLFSALRDTRAILV